MAKQKRDHTFLYEKLCWGSTWDQFTTEEKWTLHSLQSSDYFYHTNFIRREWSDGKTIYKAGNEIALRIRLRVDRRNEVTT